MEKYKYCNMGRARELSSGRREGGRKAGRQDGIFDLHRREGATYVKRISLARYRDAAFG